MTTVTPVDRPVFVVGERAPALQLVQVLGDTPSLCAMPVTRLLADLVRALDNCPSDLEPLPGSTAARWYRDVQIARLTGSGKRRTVEFSGLHILRLCELFPWAQFLVVRQLKRAIPRSRRLPTLERERILEIDSVGVTNPETLERALAFVGGAMEAVVLDLSDQGQVLRKVHTEQSGWAMEIDSVKPQPDTSGSTPAMK